MKGLWISRIEASHFDPLVAYLAVDGHRTGNFGTFAYPHRRWREDAGRASRRTCPADAPVKVIRESSKNANLLFAGTEFALWVSVDRGAHWSKFGGLPTVAVDDILIHPRDRDLVIATHGRSLWIVDDLSALEAFTAARSPPRTHTSSRRRRPSAAIRSPAG